MDVGLFICVALKAGTQAAKACGALMVLPARYGAEISLGMRGPEPSAAALARRTWQISLLSLAAAAWFWNPGASDAWMADPASGMQREIRQVAGMVLFGIWLMLPLLAGVAIGAAGGGRILLGAWLSGIAADCRAQAFARRGRDI